MNSASLHELLAAVEQLSVERGPASPSCERSAKHSPTGARSTRPLDSFRYSAATFRIGSGVGEASALLQNQEGLVVIAPLTPVQPRVGLRPLRSIEVSDSDSKSSTEQPMRTWGCSALPLHTSTAQRPVFLLPVPGRPPAHDCGAASR